MAIKAITLREAKSKENTPIIPDPTQPKYVQPILGEGDGGGSSGGDGGGTAPSAPSGGESGGETYSVPNDSGGENYGGVPSSGYYGAVPEGNSGTAGPTGQSSWPSSGPTGFTSPPPENMNSLPARTAAAQTAAEKMEHAEQNKKNASPGSMTGGATTSTPEELWQAQLAAQIHALKTAGYTDVAKLRLLEEQLASATSARNIAEQSYHQKLTNSQGAPPSGGGGTSSGWNRGAAGSGSGTGVGEYSTGLIPPSTIPELTIPVYDYGKVENLAQRAAAPGVKRLRDEIQKVQGASSDNPNVKAMNLRQALSGYGSGLESVMGGAQNVGAQLYGQEYGPQVAGATARYQGTLQQAMQAASIAAQERIAAANRASSEKLAAQNSYNQQWNSWKTNW